MVRVQSISFFSIQLDLCFVHYRIFTRTCFFLHSPLSTPHLSKQGSTKVFPFSIPIDSSAALPPCLFSFRNAFFSYPTQSSSFSVSNMLILISNKPSRETELRPSTQYIAHVRLTQYSCVNWLHYITAWETTVSPKGFCFEENSIVFLSPINPVDINSLYSTAGVRAIFPWPWYERNRCINTTHSPWLSDSAMLLIRLQGAENKDHGPFNIPVARLAASATLGFVADGKKQPWHVSKEEKKETKRQTEKLRLRQSDGPYSTTIYTCSHSYTQHTSQLVTSFWLWDGHHLTWLWPAFSHLGSACLHQESNEQQEDWRSLKETAL